LLPDSFASGTLRETGSSPGARCTWGRTSCTRGILPRAQLSGKRVRERAPRGSRLPREPEIAHSGKDSLRGVEALEEENLFFLKKNPKIGTMAPARHCGPLRPAARLCVVAIAAVGRLHPPLRRLRGRRRSPSRLADADASWPRTSRRARRRAEVAAAPGVGARRRPHREGVQASVGEGVEEAATAPGVGARRRPHREGIEAAVGEGVEAAIGEVVEEAGREWRSPGRGWRLRSVGSGVRRRSGRPGGEGRRRIWGEGARRRRRTRGERGGGGSEEGWGCGGTGAAGRTDVGGLAFIS
jgi:hypothetical protein